MADKTGRHRIVLLAAMLGAIVTCQLFLLGTSFGYLFAVAALFAFAASPIIPLIDNSVLDIVAKTNIRYGRIRLWGAAGWGLAAPVVGLLIGSVGLRVVFPIYGGLLALCLLASVRMPVRSADRRPQFWHDIRRMMRDPRWIFFILAVFAGGVGGAFVHHYLMIYMGELGASPGLRGAALSVATVSEIIAFVFADKAVKRFGSERVILLAIAATSVRLFLHFVVRSPEVILAVQLLHGLTFATLLVAGVTLARELAPAGLEATAQGIFTGVTFGAAGIVGAYLGGELLDAVGIYKMYLIASLATLFGLFVFMVYRQLGRRKSTRTG